ncbi:hypothetical protein AB0E96_35550 [Kitasatospora sp. NPDC036755]|uniref:hypothetical protein n=1 Tax=Kitasatospora sp. NPDC036755 TaxID=3154600 RepID=UPI0033D3E845
MNVKSLQLKPLTPWEDITPGWSKASLIQCAGNRLKRVMYGTEVGLVPDAAFTADCAAADVRLDALRAADPDDAGTAYAGMTFSAVAPTGRTDEERARAEYYLCHELLEYAHRHGLWYGEHPALDPGLRGRYQESGGSVEPIFAALRARGAEIRAKWEAEEAAK